MMPPRSSQCEALAELSFLEMTRFLEELRPV